MKLIDKEILLLKIDSKIEEAQKVFNVAPSSVIGGMIEGYTRIKKIVSSIEVEEVDLDVMQRMKECPYRQVGCTMYEGKILECKGACSWVVDYPKLKELKAQKGEEV